MFSTIEFDPWNLSSFDGLFYPLFLQSSHLQIYVQGMLALKHSQYFFKQNDFLQLQALSFIFIDFLFESYDLEISSSFRQSGFFSRKAFLVF